MDAMRKQLLEMDVEEDIMFNYKDYSATVLEDDLYFDSSLIKLHEKEVFIDAGALNLKTSFRFIKECQKSHFRKSVLELWRMLGMEEAQKYVAQA